MVAATAEQGKVDWQLFSQHISLHWGWLR